MKKGSRDRDKKFKNPASKIFSNNAAKLQREFDRFKETATAAAEATGVT